MRGNKPGSVMDGWRFHRANSPVAWWMPGSCGFGRQRCQESCAGKTGMGKDNGVVVGDLSDIANRFDDLVAQGMSGIFDCPRIPRFQFPCWSSQLHDEFAAHRAGDFLQSRKFQICRLTLVKMEPPPQVGQCRWLDGSFYCNSCRSCRLSVSQSTNFSSPDSTSRSLPFHSICQRARTGTFSTCLPKQAGEPVGLQFAGLLRRRVEAAAMASSRCHENKNIIPATGRFHLSQPERSASCAFRAGVRSAQSSLRRTRLRQAQACGSVLRRQRRYPAAAFCRR